jgi:hypothetical protein
MRHFVIGSLEREGLSMMQGKTGERTGWRRADEEQRVYSA